MLGRVTMRTRILFFLIVSAVVITTVCLGFTGKLGRLLSRNEVATTWIGLSEDELYMFRIDLLPSGGGEVAYSFLDDSPKGMTVGSWSYDPKVGSRILIQLRSNSSGINQLAGEVVGVRMELVISHSDWKRTVFLRREPDLKPRWERLQEEMKASP